MPSRQAPIPRSYNPVMDVVRTPRGLDRGHRRQHVQRQERRAHPPPAPCADRPPARPDLQAGGRHALRGRSHRVAQRTADSVGERADRAPSCWRRSRPDTEVVGIDEGQFFDAELPAVASELARRGVRVIVAGLDQDYLGKPFEPMPQLLAVAEYITKTRAICMVCGNPANHTQRLVASTDRVLLGAQGTYEARCRRCFDPTLSAKRDPPQGSRREGAMTLQELAPVLRQILLALGLLFLIVDAAGGCEILRWWRRRKQAVVMWPGPQAAVLRDQARHWHDARHPAPREGVRRVSGCSAAWPRCRRVRRGDDVRLLRLHAAAVDAHPRGLYADGVWTDTGFMPYSRSAASPGRATTRWWWRRGRRCWRAASSARASPRRSPRLLRDKIASHAIEMDAGPGLHLGARDARESV